MTILDNEYKNYLTELAKFFDNSDETYMIKLGEEVGEACEAFSMWKGTNPLKGRVVPHEVAKELGDVAVTALLAILNLGWDPGDILEWHRDKMEQRIQQYHAGQL